jgi:hypothetical protein
MSVRDLIAEGRRVTAMLSPELEPEAAERAAITYAADLSGFDRRLVAQHFAGDAPGTK